MDNNQTIRYRLEIDRITAVLASFGWTVVATDSRSDSILLTIGKEKSIMDSPPEPRRS